MNKVCVVTGSRAEYGLLKKLMFDLGQSENVVLQLVVTGMHLSPEFGSTWKVIEDDGFKIDEKVETLLSSDSVIGVSKAIGLGVIGFSDVLNRLSPDIVVILGDRFEILAAALAASIANIPIAHLHGGELTEGLFTIQLGILLQKCLVLIVRHMKFTGVELFRWVSSQIVSLTWERLGWTQ